LPDQAAACCPWPNPVAHHQHANSLQLGLFSSEFVVRSHEQKRVTRCFDRARQAQNDCAVDDSRRPPRARQRIRSPPTRPSPAPASERKRGGHSGQAGDPCDRLAQHGDEAAEEDGASAVAGDQRLGAREHALCAALDPCVARNQSVSAAARTTRSPPQRTAAEARDL
jgi:hypothetical protein